MDTGVYYCCVTQQNGVCDKPIFLEIADEFADENPPPSLEAGLFI